MSWRGAYTKRTRPDLICAAGITLVKADDFATWWFTIEVMGESLYQVRRLSLLWC